MVNRLMPGELVAGQKYIYYTPIPGVYYILRPAFEDERGFFTSINIDDLEPILGHPFVTRQTNRSRSKVLVLRGVHLNGWNKLIYVASGLAECVLVDLRQDSPTFRQHIRVLLGGNADYTAALYVPRGVGNSFLALEQTDYVYLVDQTYENRGPNDDLGVNPFDPELAIDWGLNPNAPIMSDKDRQAPTLAELLASGRLDSYKLYS